MSIYKERFASRAAVEEYEAIFADPSTYASCLYRVEARLLEESLAGLNFPQSASYLDFATGTGRVLTLLEDCFSVSEGIDISEEMVRVCRGKVKKSEVRCGDITAEDTRNQYDLITSFRFFLNADGDLRKVVAGALKARLKSHGRLVVNNHGRPMSMNFLGAIRRALGHPSKQRVLSDKKFQKIFTTHGFRLEERRGYGVLGGRLAKLIGARACSAIEGWLAGSWLAGMFGTCAIYVFAADE